MAKCHAVGTERIQMGRPDTGMPQDTERITSPLVYYNQEHILLLTHGCLLCLLLGMRAFEYVDVFQDICWVVQGPVLRFPRTSARPLRLLASSNLPASLG